MLLSSLNAEMRSKVPKIWKGADVHSRKPALDILPECLWLQILDNIPTYELKKIRMTCVTFYDLGLLIKERRSTVRKGDIFICKRRLWNLTYKVLSITRCYLSVVYDKYKCTEKGSYWYEAQCRLKLRFDKDGKPYVQCRLGRAYLLREYKPIMY